MRVISILILSILILPGVGHGEPYPSKGKKLFFSNMYYSLNGWQIKDNIYNNTEIFVAGLLFWFLLSSFFLFFRSNYFKNKLRN